jgi:hypothetical protein
VNLSSRIVSPCSLLILFEKIQVWGEQSERERERDKTKTKCNVVVSFTGKFALELYVQRLNGWRMASSGMLRRMALVRTDVSEELSASFIRVTRIGDLGTTLAVSSNRSTLRRNTIFFSP